MQVFRDALDPAILRPLAMTLIGFAATFSAVAYMGPLVTAITGLEGTGIGAMQVMVGVGSIAGIALGARAAGRADRASGFVAASFMASAASLLMYSVLMRLPASPLVLTGALAVSIATGAAMLLARIPVIQARLVAAAAPDSRPVALALNGSMVFLG